MQELLSYITVRREIIVTEKIEVYSNTICDMRDSFLRVTVV